VTMGNEIWMVRAFNTATNSPSSGLVWHNIKHDCPMPCQKSQSEKPVRHGIGQNCLIPCRTLLFDWFVWHSIRQLYPMPCRTTSVRWVLTHWTMTFDHLEVAQNIWATSQ
jgi:hypothetical protein